MSVASIINDAHNLIERDGWVQGKLRTKKGYCIVGAIVAAASGEDIELRWRAVEYVAMACGSQFVSIWNDCQDRTKREVLKVLKCAVLIAQECEHMKGYAHDRIRVASTPFN